MKYYRDFNNAIYAFESNGSQDAYIGKHLIPVTKDEAFKLLQPELSPEESFKALVAQYDQAIESHLRTEAVTHGYANIERACMYAAFPNPFQAESQSFVKWVGEVWAYCYGEMKKVQEGLITVPSVQEVIDGLPQRVPPAT